MLGRFVPAVSVLAQNLHNTLNQRNADRSAGKVDLKGAGFTGRTQGPAAASTPFARAGSSSLNQGLATASTPFASALHGQTAFGRDADPKTETIFSDQDKQKIKAGKNVFVAGFSSQGRGHTSRMLTPLGQAAKQGDTVVIALPPHWEFDKGNEAPTLKSFKEKYEKEGINVVTVQSDKTIWGFYEKDGPSDNFKILEEFGNKSKRDSANTPFYGSLTEKGQGYKHTDIVQQVVNIAGADKMDQIKVFEDMDPFLGKAATRAGIPQDQIVGQSNHVLLLDADEYLGPKSDAFLVKANGNGHNGQMATIAFDAKINSTRKLGESLAQLGIKADDKAVDVRKDVVRKMLVHGQRHDLASTAPVTGAGAVLVSPKADADSIDRGVYLYLNEYTDPAAQHVRKRLIGEGDTTPKQQAAYEKAMFVFCGKGAFSEQYTANKANVANAMHIAQAANFDGVAAAGFGTSSEMHYLLENDAYQGSFLLMPMERQHEQEANAHHLLPAALSEHNKDRVEAAENIDDLANKLDGLVLARATTDKGLGETTMAPLLEATQRESDSLSDKAANLLGATGPGMSDLDSRLLEENNWRSREAGRKEMRQLNKVMIPVLEAISNSESEATIQLSTAAGPRTVNVQALVDGLDSPATLRELTGVNITNQSARNMTEELATELRPIMGLPEGPVREYMADLYRKEEYANKKFTVGY